jgi:hypothetical protein
MTHGRCRRAVGRGRALHQTKLESLLVQPEMEVAGLFGPHCADGEVHDARGGVTPMGAKLWQTLTDAQICLQMMKFAAL